jgi:hypothetical protein
MEASFDGGEIVTKPLKMQGPALHLNAKSDFGEIVIELLDPAGQVITVSKPIQRDALDIPVEWKREISKEALSLVKLHITLKNARLFALWCR